MSRVVSLFPTIDATPRRTEITAPTGRDFERLLDARRRSVSRSSERTDDDRARRRIADRPDGEPSGDDEVRAGRATTKLGSKRTSRVDRADRRTLDRPEPDRSAEPPPTAATATTAPTASGATSATGSASPASDRAAGDEAAAATVDPTTSAAIASSTGALIGVPLDPSATPVEGGAGTPTVVPLGTPGPVLEDAGTQVGGDATDAVTAGTPPEQALAVDAPAAEPGAVTAEAGATGPAPDADASGPAATAGPSAMPAPATHLRGAADSAATSGQAAPGDASGDEAPAEDAAAGAVAARDAEEPVRPRTTPAEGSAPTAVTADANGAPVADQTADAAPVTRSGAVARAIDAALVGDRANAAVTTRLAVELDDATRVAVHVHGQSVRVDVIEDANTLLDAGWRRDVAEGIRRHGLEYERQGADANDRRRRRDDDDDSDPMTARDGGSRNRRRFTIDLDPAPSS